MFIRHDRPRPPLSQDRILATGKREAERLPLGDDIRGQVAKEASDMTARVGKEAPDFEARALVDGAFKNVKLSDHRGKWVVLCFYPGDFTFV